MCWFEDLSQLRWFLRSASHYWPVGPACVVVEPVADVVVADAGASASVAAQNSAWGAAPWSNQQTVVAAAAIVEYVAVIAAAVASVVAVASASEVGVVVAAATVVVEPAAGYKRPEMRLGSMKVAEPESGAGSRCIFAAVAVAVFAVVGAASAAACVIEVAGVDRQAAVCLPESGTAVGTADWWVVAVAAEAVVAACTVVVAASSAAAGTIAEPNRAVGTAGAAAAAVEARGWRRQSGSEQKAPRCCIRRWGRRCCWGHDPSRILECLRPLGLWRWALMALPVRHHLDTACLADNRLRVDVRPCCCCRVHWDAVCSSVKGSSVESRQGQGLTRRRKESRKGWLAYVARGG